jgi:hypothetical protein
MDDQDAEVLKGEGGKGEMRKGTDRKVPTWYVAIGRGQTAGKACSMGQSEITLPVPVLRAERALSSFPISLQYPRCCILA